MHDIVRLGLAVVFIGIFALGVRVLVECLLGMFAGRKG